eukprot:CAMPEP_0117535416 /NCGR_PEP_ID=MMETSP0784-20121206/40924_1 /TAXON_ID=39447 /ORGANISM="" /LENGTH=134 /DNA_ID=CAMNT_0005331943 /DNA_START=47 /DNA_END=451 /DNA_ORIENTATION=-
MLPYILILPLWLLIALVVPAAQSLHALHGKDATVKKDWLCYWIVFMLGAWFLYCFEWLVRIPFYVLSFVVDVYYEVQLLVVAYLVLPRFMGIAKVQSLAETNANSVGPAVATQLQAVAAQVQSKIKESGLLHVN